MSYFLLIIILFLAGSGLYKFFLGANPKQVKALLLSSAAIGIGLASLFLAVTGRLPAAIGILIALWPVAVSWLRTKAQYGSAPSQQASVNITEKEAYEVLGLEETATEGDIKEAHIRLMKKVHPDQKGSDWLAKKINAAKDLLLKSRA